MVDVAQSVRASDCGSEGRRFETDLPPVETENWNSVLRFSFFTSRLERELLWLHLFST